MKRTPLRRMSLKRRRQAGRRRVCCMIVKNRDGYCKAGEIIRSRFPAHTCWGRSTVHEIISRARGGSIYDPENAVSACLKCHSWVHSNPALATELGLLRHSWDRSHTS